MTPDVLAAGLTVSLDHHLVVDGVDFEVAGGEWLTLIGPNGAGKSTVLRALAGLVKARGRVEVLGDAVRSLGRRERARRVALVPQVPAVPPGLPVAEYVLLGRTPHLSPLSQEGPADLAAAERALEVLDLGGLAGRFLETLSGGERQRAFLARALAQAPAVLLLDEPTTSLDLGHQQDFLELVDRLRRETGLTVVSTMHDLTLAGQYADRLLLLDGGRVLATGTPEAVLDEDLLARTYGASVRVSVQSGVLVVVPTRHVAGSEAPAV